MTITSFFVRVAAEMSAICRRQSDGPATTDLLDFRRQPPPHRCLRSYVGIKM
jgi:hypothetical protein